MAPATTTPVDAFNGSEDDVTEVQFNYRGVAYTIALDPSNAAAFDAALQPYLDVSRRTGGRREEDRA